MMDLNDKITLILPVDDIFSENTFLAPGIKKKWRNGKHINTPFLFKHPAVRWYQSHIASMIWHNYYDYLHTNHELFNKAHYYRSKFTFLLKKSYDTRDVTNCIKSLEDAIVVGINNVFGVGNKGKIFDDSQMLGSTLDKIYSPDEDKEYIVYELSKVDLDEHIKSHTSYVDLVNSVKTSFRYVDTSEYQSDDIVE